jgi:hypothetical protein
MQDETTLNALCIMIDQCTRNREVPTTCKVVNQVFQKKRKNKEFILSAQIKEYDMHNAILDLGSNVNVLPRKMWEMMGKSKLVWSNV